MRLSGGQRGTGGGGGGGGALLSTFLTLAVVLTLAETLDVEALCSTMCRQGMGGNLCHCSAVHFAGKRTPTTEYSGGELLRGQEQQGSLLPEGGDDEPYLGQQQHPAARTHGGMAPSSHDGGDPQDRRTNRRHQLELFSRILGSGDRKPEAPVRIYGSGNEDDGEAEMTDLRRKVFKIWRQYNRARAARKSHVPHDVTPE